LWGFIASLTLGNVIRNQHYNSNVNAIGASLIALGPAVQVERALTIAWLSSGRQSSQLRTQLLADRRALDADIATVRSATASISSGLSAPAQSRLDSFLAAVSGLPKVRAAVDAGTDSTVTAFNAYAGINTAEVDFSISRHRQTTRPSA
jgi:Nitrate and nitrite sensing